MENSKKPDIRFPGFTDDWEQREFHKLAEIRRGLTYKPENVQNQGIRVLRSSNIIEDIFEMREDDVFVNPEAVKIDFVQDGDILITSANGSSRLVGKHALIYGVNNNAVHGGFMLLARAEQPEFVNSLMSAAWYEKFINVFVSGGNGAIGNLRKSDLEKQKVFVPSEVEQEKIGEFFKTLNETITLHQRELEELKSTKKGFLQKMFPKEGEKKPEIRFTGFTDDWEQCKLGEISNIKTGSSDLQDADSNGIYPFFVRSDNIEKSNRYIFDGEAILIPGEGRLGEIYHYINGKFDYHQRVYKLSNFLDFNTSGKFVLYSMQSNFKRHAMKFTVKATVDSLRLPMLTDFDISVPNFEEQDKIGQFFNTLDDTIALHQRELEYLKETKKAFLQKMFI